MLIKFTNQVNGRTVWFESGQIETVRYDGEEDGISIDTNSVCIWVKESAEEVVRKINKAGMPKFIKLTVHHDGRIVAIRVDRIESFVLGVGDATGTTMVFTSGVNDEEFAYWVKETPEEIEKLIEKAYTEE